MQDKGHDHYPQEWADTTETTDSGLEEAKNQGKEMLAAQVEFDAALRENCGKLLDESLTRILVFCSPVRPALS